MNWYIENDGWYADAGEIGLSLLPERDNDGDVIGWSWAVSPDEGDCYSPIELGEVKSPAAGKTKAIAALKRMP